MDLNNLLHPAPHGPLTPQTITAFVLLDVFLIVVLARICGGLAARVGQARIVGEIVAGLVLGPTLLGSDLSAFIAPPAARGVIGAIATIALVLFMFVVGLELDVRAVRGRGTQAATLAALSVAVPALVGVPVAAVLHTSRYAGAHGQRFVVFALFVGAALSVTSFPVMAHILMERGQINTPMGALGVATTAIMSVLVFAFIAVATSVASSAGIATLVLKAALTGLLVIVSLTVVRPLLRRLRTNAGGGLDGDAVAIVFAGVVLYGLIADRLGVNALVGGFLWGFLMPADPALRAAIMGRFRDLAVVVLLPVFTATAGFAADLKLLDATAVPALAVLLAAAILSKFVATAPGRALGLSWRETAYLATLFNTRGLLVLVVGLIGLSAQIVTTTTFTMIVVVSLATNLMTLPLLGRLDRPKRDLTSELVEAVAA